MFELTKEKSYSAHIGGLAEILDWSHEFCEQYYDKVLNWEMFKSSSNNIYNAFSLDDLIVSLGRERLKKFYTQTEIRRIISGIDMPLSNKKNNLDYKMVSFVLMLSGTSLFHTKGELEGFVRTVSFKQLPLAVIISFDKRRTEDDLIKVMKICNSEETS